MAPESFPRSLSQPLPRGAVLVHVGWEFAKYQLTACLCTGHKERAVPTRRGQAAPPPLAGGCERLGALREALSQQSGWGVLRAGAGCEEWRQAGIPRGGRAHRPGWSLEGSEEGRPAQAVPGERPRLNCCFSPAAGVASRVLLASPLYPPSALASALPALPLRPAWRDTVPRVWGRPFSQGFDFSSST